MSVFVSRLCKGLIALSFLTGVSASYAELYLGEDLQEKKFAAGEIDPTETQGGWVMAFSNYTRQKAQDFTPGYNAKTFGGGLGLDCRPMDALLLGAGVRFDYTDLNSTNYVGQNANFTSTKAMLYGRYDINERWYLNALVAYGFNQYNNHRYVFSFPIPGAVANIGEANGDVDGRQWNLVFNSGYQLSYDKWQFLPNFNIDYTHLALEDYADFVGSMAVRRYADESYYALKFSVDFILAYQNEFPLAQLMPYIHFKAIYDTKAELETTADVFGGGTAYVNYGPTPSHSSYQTGVGFTVFGQGSVQVSMRYDYTFKHHYRDHAGVMYIRHEW